MNVNLATENLDGAYSSFHFHSAQMCHKKCEPLDDMTNPDSQHPPFQIQRHKTAPAPDHCRFLSPSQKCLGMEKSEVGKSLGRENSEKGNILEPN